MPPRSWCRICLIPRVRRGPNAGVWVCRVCDLTGCYAWWEKFTPPKAGFW